MAHENRCFLMIFSYLLNMVILHNYVKWPEGNVIIVTSAGATAYIAKKFCSEKMPTCPRGENHVPRLASPSFLVVNVGCESVVMFFLGGDFLMFDFESFCLPDMYIRAHGGPWLKQAVPSKHSGKIDVTCGGFGPFPRTSLLETWCLQQ